MPAAVGYQCYRFLELAPSSLRALFSLSRAIVVEVAVLWAVVEVDFKKLKTLLRVSQELLVEVRRWSLVEAVLVEAAIVGAPAPCAIQVHLRVQK
jgi:hypothetical protein